MKQLRVGRTGSFFALLFSLSLILIWPDTTWAHPGHGASLLHGFFHPLSGVDHLLAALAVGIWGAQLGGRSTLRLPMAFAAALLVGAALGLQGVAFSHTETWIALSVAFLGAAIVLSPRLSWAQAAPFVLFFGALHGNAHGCEMPLSSSMVTYGAGFVAATVLLHVAGIVGVKAARHVLAANAATFALRAAGLAVLLSGSGMLFEKI